jgi:hypothetical protein
MSQDAYRVQRGLRVYSSPAPRFLTHPRENEIRVQERDGRRWLQQWRMPPYGEDHQRTWVEVRELPSAPSNARRIDEWA